VYTVVTMRLQAVMQHVSNPLEEDWQGKTMDGKK
jgi:hypothetical protein